MTDSARAVLVGRGRAVSPPRRSRPLGPLGIQLLVVLAAIVAWQLFSYTEIGRIAMFPGFVETAGAFLSLMGGGQFWAAVGTTLFVWAVALVISVGIGVPLGLLIGRLPFLEQSTSLTIDFLRTIPSFALIPVSLLIVGATNTMVIITAVIAGVWPLLIQSIYAAKGADPVLRQVARSYHLTLAHRIRYVLAPDALAFIWPGLRLAVTVVLLVAVGAQLIGGAPGLGFEIQAALTSNKQDVMLAYVVASMLLGLSFNSALGWAQKKWLWWHPSVRTGREAGAK